MRFHAALSDHESTPHAANALIASARAADLAEADLAFVFFTAHHADEAINLMAAIGNGFPIHAHLPGGDAALGLRATHGAVLGEEAVQFHATAAG